MSYALLLASHLALKKTLAKQKIESQPAKIR